jgi:hypothetical protein
VHSGSCTHPWSGPRSELRKSIYTCPSKPVSRVCITHGS